MFDPIKGIKENNTVTLTIYDYVILYILYKLSFTAVYSFSQQRQNTQGEFL